MQELLLIKEGYKIIEGFGWHNIALKWSTHPKQIFCDTGFPTLAGFNHLIHKEVLGGTRQGWGSIVVEKQFGFIYNFKHFDNFLEKLIFLEAFPNC